MSGSSSSSASFESTSSSTGAPVDSSRLLAVRVDTTPGFVVNRDTGYRVVVTVTDAVGMDRNVFRYLYDPPTGPNDPLVKYNGVCSPTDLTAFPAGDPLPDAVPMWCRRDSVDLVFRSTAEADDMLVVMREELQALVDSLNRMDRLEAVDTLVFQ